MTYAFLWCSNPILREGLCRIARGEKFGFTEAIDIVKMLGAEAKQLTIERVKETEYKLWHPTKRVGPKWTAGNPCGWVDHYTSATTAASTLRWFSNMPRPEGMGESSAHYLVDIDGSCIQIVDPLESVAWHATKANPTSIGVEHVNVGRLTPSGRNLLWMDKYVYHMDMARPPEEAGAGALKGYWEPFSTVQVLTNITIKRLMLMAIPMMRPENFKQHSDIVPGVKIDCGPLWPMEQITKLATSEINILNMDWANKGQFLTEETRLSMIKEVAKVLSPVVQNEQPVQYSGEVCEANPNLLAYR